ncbi:MAG TPA: DUF4954 family protein [Sumerlaeia bacterium]|nr:DUF4954 family protein [Sumerlaeia bacterium]
MDYRNLTKDEIRELEKGGCSAEDWGRVLVADGFAAERVRSARLSGDVRIGRLSGKISLPGGLEAPAGISDAALHNCTVGDDVLIRNVARYIANYDIADGAVVCDVSLLVTEGESAFGNGTKVEALNEGGGREVTIFDRLSSQVAYILALYRYRPETIEKLEGMIDDYVKAQRSARGSVGKGARIMGCGALTNVRIGPAAEISGAVKLANGTVNSCEAHPAVVGDGVIAENFIFSSGSRVDGGAMLTGCFVGQGTRIGRQYSAENSLFFANCEGFHGEACAIFAGPYTVTHHKSTLLIAGLFSFYNAGSGTNESNHMYKLGPVHQGILERGSKTGSFAYLLWSSHLGAFSAVIGKHYSKFDASDFPFSYVMEGKGGSVLIPAMNLTTVGTQRDGAKWPDRDRRKDPDRLDLLHFDVLNPYTVGRMMRGRRILGDLSAKTPGDRDAVEYKGLSIAPSRLKKGIELYSLGIGLYLNGKIAARAEALLEQTKPEDLVATILKSRADGTGNWVDLCGLMTPASRSAEVLDRVASGAVADLPALETALRALYEGYSELEWDWVVPAWLEEIGKKAEDVTRDDVRGAVTAWKEAVLQYNDLVLKDAKKEFEGDVRIGFGIDGGPEAVAADFDSVRGTFDGNKFVKQVKQASKDITARAERILGMLP